MGNEYIISEMPLALPKETHLSLVVVLLLVVLHKNEKVYPFGVKRGFVLMNGLNIVNLNEVENGQTSLMSMSHSGYHFCACQRNFVSLLFC